VIAFNLNWGLLGITMVQIYFYHLSFPRDPVIIKCLVYFLGTLESITSILMLVDNYRWFASGFGDLKGLDNPLMSPFYSPIADSIVGLIVQLFYCYRIYILRKSFWLPMTIALVSVIPILLLKLFHFL
ncbi:hypothetical protein K435DRAFT_686497, partial [Dendrothele bispora CBS 962.96]